MPHVAVSLWPGKSPEQKQQLTDAIVDSVTSLLGYGEESVSVALIEVEPDRWMDAVYQPEIAGRWEQLTKPPGYGPGAPR